MVLPHSMTVQRLTSVGTVRESYTDRPDPVACFLQPATDANAPGDAGVISQGSRAYIAFASDVRNKDRVTINGNQYQVSGVVEHPYGQSWPHKVLQLNKLG